MFGRCSTLLFREYTTIATGVFEGRFKYEMNGEDFDCPSSILADLLFAEYKFRYYAQLKESVERNNNDEYRAIAMKYDELENDLYLKESALPIETLRDLYDSLRVNPRWYLRMGLSIDCAERGGCCARDCGCCAKRAQNLPRKGISGHCSLACQCCDKLDGQNLGSMRVDIMDRKFEDALRSDNPSHLALLATLYFEPLSMSPRTGAQMQGGESEATETTISQETTCEVSDIEPPPYERYAGSGSATPPIIN